MGFEYWHIIGPDLNAKFTTNLQNRHNFWWWCPFSTSSSPIESPQSQLSIGEEIIENGPHHQKLWSPEVVVSGEIETKMSMPCENWRPYSSMSIESVFVQLNSLRWFDTARDINLKWPYLLMVMSIFDDFFTDRKLRLGAFDRWRNRRKWTSPSKVMAILKIRRKFRIQIRSKNMSILESHTHTHACSHTENITSSSYG